MMMEYDVVIRRIVLNWKNQKEAVGYDYFFIFQLLHLSSIMAVRINSFPGSWSKETSEE